jgi:aminoglycoside phosphotransferase (APT) family kinase protein
VPSRKTHTAADELAILHERLPLVARRHPRWSPDVHDILRQCDRVAASYLESPEDRFASTGIHRDFYPDQVLVEPESGRLFLLDFDLYCRGDPALDVGNFIGHLTELSVRQHGKPDAFAEHENAMVDRYGRLAGAEIVPRIRGYAALTLARHLHICTRFPDREPLLGHLIEVARGLLRRPSGPRR